MASGTSRNTADNLRKQAYFPDEDEKGIWTDCRPKRGRDRKPEEIPGPVSTGRIGRLLPATSPLGNTGLLPALPTEGGGGVSKSAALSTAAGGYHWPPLESAPQGARKRACDFWT